MSWIRGWLLCFQMIALSPLRTLYSTYRVYEARYMCVKVLIQFEKHVILRMNQ